MLACVTAAAPLHGAEPWTLTTADFRAERVTLRGIDDNGISLVGADGKPRTVAFDQVLQIDRAGSTRAATSGRFVLALTNGEALAGDPKGLDGEQLVWSSASLGEVRVPLTRVARLGRANRTVDPPARATEDVVTLVNGDTVRGIVGDVTAAAFTVQSAGGDATEVPLESVAAVHFAAVAGAGAAPGEPTGRAFRVSLGDSTTITAPSVKLAGEQLTMTLADKSTR